MKSPNNIERTFDTIENELEAYLEEPTENVKDPLKFWKNY